MTANVRRHDSLEAQNRGMKDAGRLARVLYLLRYADAPLTHATMKDFAGVLSAHLILPLGLGLCTANFVA
jgi:hypothetical protein